ncbi:TPA: replication protein [Escherichia coli]|uniref:replication protein n=1 Tax=Citrobacter sp. Cb031 TaxID=2985025 RepID=UPI00257BD83D|nr:replication protein [Citrobacter sp. Cb031]MDM3462172.1 replication protein [Citrobacter sp. Cb031]
MKTFYTAQKCTECLSSSSVNNSTEDEKNTDFSPDVEGMTEDSEEEIVDFENMDQSTRRKLMRRLRETPFKRQQSGSSYEPGSELDAAWRSAVEKNEARSGAERARRAALAPAVASLLADAELYSVEIAEIKAVSLLMGSRLEIDGKVYQASADGQLITRQLPDESRTVKFFKSINLPSHFVNEWEGEGLVSTE